MSPKLQAKNLSYDATLPPFLQRLRALNSAGDGRHERPLARPKRARNADDEEEDAPMYVDERGVEMRAEEVRVMKMGGEGAKGEGGGGAEGTGGGDGREEREERTLEKAAVIGAGRRRKAGRVVGAADEEGGKDGAGEIAESPAEKGAPPYGPSKPKKKPKKVKLSFGDDE